MRRRLIIGTISFALVGGGIFLWYHLNSRENTIRFHIKGWHKAVEYSSSRRQRPFFSRFFDSRSSSAYYHDVAKAHEQALLEVGYLTNCEIRLTNQVITRECSSNFFRQIRARFGTNIDQVWLCPYLPNRDGIAPTLPAKDVGEWERIFRDCAARYASNIPPSLSPNSPSQ
jgi:hypothetical protein